MATRQRLSREESREQTRALLLKSAAKVFARLGFEGASVDEIAESAGFSRGAFYSNFASKEVIFLELLTRHLDRDLAGLQRAASESSTLDELADRIAASYVDLGANADWCLLASEFQLFLSRTGKPDTERAKTYDAYRERLAQLLAQAFDRFGAQMGMPAEELAGTLIGLSHGLALERSASQGKVSREVTGRAIRALLFGVARA